MKFFDMVNSGKDDLQMRNIMVKYWTNFAKYGNPSPVMSDEMTQWLTYSSEKVEYSHLLEVN